MYLWVILATFLAMLYSFNLSVRSDMDRAYVETKAGVLISKMRAQQNALKDACLAQDPLRTGYAAVNYRPGDGVNSSTGDTIDITDYLPLGHKIDASAISKVFCFTNEDYDNNCTASEEGDGRSCCSDDYTTVYVVTFQPIRTRWLNPQTGMPNADLIGAATRIPGYGTSFGYTMTKDNKLVISGGRVIPSYEEPEEDADNNPTGKLIIHKNYEYRTIFPAIINDSDFQEKCGGDNTHCLFAIQQIYS